MNKNLFFKIINLSIFKNFRDCNYMKLLNVPHIYYVLIYTNVLHIYYYLSQCFCFSSFLSIFILNYYELNKIII